MKMVKQINNNKGVTLVELTVYITALLLLMGILTGISTFFNNNLNIIRFSGKYAGELDKFNSVFIQDVKANTSVNIDDKFITFINGTTYKYSENDKSIYRGQVKVATNISYFKAEKKTITVNNIDKQVIAVNIIIGNSTKNLINKTIEYTLKYW